MPESPKEKGFLGLIFLDLDGTIEDSRLDMAGSANAVRSRLDLSIQKEQSMFPHVMRGMEHLYRQCFPEVFENPELLSKSARDESQILDSQAELYQLEYSQRIVAHTKCYPGMEEALKTLSEKYILALYTNKPESLSRLLLEKLNIFDFFSLIYGGDTLPESKPSALPIETGMQTIAERLALPLDTVKQRTVMVGDSAGDIKAAKAAGVASVWAAYGYYDQKPDTDPEFIVGRPEEIPDLIQRILPD